MMTPGRYTELFFLDEATALAAGHRPCAECQRARYRLFREHWAAANPELAGSPTPRAEEMDGALHAERVSPGGGKRMFAERLSRLPSGVMVADGEGQPCLLLDGALLPWTPGGYGPALPAPESEVFQVLTPPSIVRAIARGYPIDIHSSAKGFSEVAGREFRVAGDTGQGGRGRERLSSSSRRTASK